MSDISLYNCKQKLILEAIATGSVDRSIKIFSQLDFNLLATMIGHEWEINFMKFFNYDSKLVSISADGIIFIWDLQIYQVIQRIDLQSAGISTFDIGINDEWLCVGKDYDVQIWDIVNYDHFKTLSYHTDMVQNVVISNDQKFIYSFSNDQMIAQWSLDSFEINKTAESEHNTGFLPCLMTLSKDDEFLAVAGPINSISLYKAKNLALIKVIPEIHSSPVRALLFSQNGQYIITGDKNGQINIIEIQTYNIQKLLIHQKVIFSLIFAQNENILLSSSADDSVCVWQLEKQV